MRSLEDELIRWIVVVGTERRLEKVLFERLNKLDKIFNSYNLVFACTGLTYIIISNRFTVYPQTFFF